MELHDESWCLAHAERKPCQHGRRSRQLGVLKPPVGTSISEEIGTLYTLPLSFPDYPLNSEGLWNH
jgi:hypothetical protein